MPLPFGGSFNFFILKGLRGCQGALELFLAMPAGLLRGCPKEFSGAFWELFHEADKEAEKTFLQIRERLERFHEVAQNKS